jgi:hypothetical protein
MAKLTLEKLERHLFAAADTGPERPTRRSFSTWLLELVFADREVRQREVACCDACQRLLIDQKGPAAFVNEVLST